MQISHKAAGPLPEVRGSFIVRDKEGNIKSHGEFKGTSPLTKKQLEAKGYPVIVQPPEEK